MKIKYLGPSESINVGGYGPHRKDEEKEYPDDFAADLIVTSKRNQFEVVQPPAPGPPKADWVEPAIAEPVPEPGKPQKKRKA